MIEREVHNTTQMSEAKALINEFCRHEYGEDAEFDNLKEIGIAYTTTENEEYPVQAYVNLVDFSITRYLCDKIIESRQYSSLGELIKNELEWLSFESLTDATEEQIAMANSF